MRGIREGWKGGSHRDAEREIRNQNKVQERGRKMREEE